MRSLTLVQQRLYQIAGGYADQNDATTLRHDPLLKLVCGRLPVTGAAPGQSADPLPVRERHQPRDLLPAGGRAGRGLPARTGARRRPDAHPARPGQHGDPVHGEQEGRAITATTASTCTIHC